MAFPEFLIRAFRYADSNPLGYSDYLGLAHGRAGGCCDCPEGIWDYSGASWSVGVLFWGHSSFTGTFTCASNGLKVEVEGECKLRGLMVMVGAQWDFSVDKWIPGGKACSKSDLLDPSGGFGASGPGGSLRAGLGIGATKGSKNTGNLSIGLSGGAGAFRPDCRIRPYRPPIDPATAPRWWEH